MLRFVLLSRQKLMSAAGVLLLGLCATAAADEPPTGVRREPIVLEPSEDPAPPPVRLDGTAPPAAGEPMRLSEFTLTDQLGREVTLADLHGHPWVASFVFTNCFGYCPNMMGRVRLELYDRVDDPNLRFVTITVDPERDTVARMREYAELYGADPERWKFLTGSYEEIYRLIREGFQVPVAEAVGADRRPGFEFVHSLSLIHVSPEGELIGKYDSREDAELVTLRRVLAGDIKTPADHRIVGSVLETATGHDASSGDVAAQPEQQAPQLPAWVSRLPTTNAMLNTLATLLLIAGLLAIKAGKASLHKRMMLTAFATSVAFLACYLTYHIALHHFTGQRGKPFEGTGPVRIFYLGMLLSHVILAAAVPVLAVVTIVRGLREQWEAHRRIARITFPIWLYVSVTGVIIYGMLYHWPAS